MVERDFKSLLGGVELNANGEIKSAKAAFFNFIGKMNGTAAKLQGIGIDNALGEYVRI